MVDTLEDLPDGIITFIWDDTIYYSIKKGNEISREHGNMIFSRLSKDFVPLPIDASGYHSFKLIVPKEMY